MNRRRLMQAMYNGDQVPSDVSTDLRLPTVPTTANDSGGTARLVDDYVTAKHAVGAGRNKVILTLDDLPFTIRDTQQGGGIKLLDFPAGIFRFTNARASLTFTTTSVLASTLNGSSGIYWGVGTGTHSTTGSVAGDECNIIALKAATSSATINVANSETYGAGVTPVTIYGYSTPTDVLLNVAVPTATDIDADATVTASGTIEIEYEDLGLYSQYPTASRMPTREFWQNCPWQAINEGNVDGWTFFDDFISGGLALANNQVTGLLLDRGWMGQTAATTPTISVLANEPTGVVKLFSSTDNEDAIISNLAGENTAGQVVFEAGKRFWFEARIRCINITDAKFGVFCGFAEEALCDTTELIAAAGTLADKDYVGFHRLEGDGDKLDLVYNTAAGGGTTLLADAVTLTANTWVKIGIYCDGTTVKFLLDGVEITNGSVALSAANFPDGEEMAFYLGIMNAHADDANVDIDWVKVAQQRQ